MNSRRPRPFYATVLDRRLPHGFGSEWDDEGYFPDRSNVPRDLQLLWAADSYAAEVCNGGFIQFFMNDTGKLSPEAAEGFRLLGLDDLAGAIDLAMGFFGSPYPRSQEERQAGWSSISKEACDAWARSVWTAWNASNSASPVSFHRWNPFDGLSGMFLAGLGRDRQRFNDAADRLAARYA